jgi:hypothetical protein
VAEKDPGDSGGDEVPLGSEVFRPNQECRGLGTEDGGIGEELRAGSLSGIDHGFVLRDADALGGQGGRRYEQNACGSRECSDERCGLAVVSFANMHAECGEVCSLGWRACSGDDLGGGNALEQVGDDEAAELAGGSGNYDHVLIHVLILLFDKVITTIARPTDRQQILGSVLVETKKAR